MEDIVILLVILFWLIVVTNAIYWPYVIIKCIIESRKGKSGSSDYPSPIKEHLRGFWLFHFFFPPNTSTSISAWFLNLKLSSHTALQEASSNCASFIPSVSCPRFERIKALIIISSDSLSSPMMNAIIRANIGINPDELSTKGYAEAYCQAIWLEGFRLQNQAELLASMLGNGKK